MNVDYTVKLKINEKEIAKYKYKNRQYVGNKENSVNFIQDLKIS